MIAVALIARATADLGPALESLAAAGAPEPTVHRLPRPGGWADARNEALLACGDAEVLALVEDDVRVAPTWWTALQDAWSVAPGLGATGGPLTLGHAPSWVPPLYRGTFGLQDEGSRSYHGGNVAFRTAALRGVGGFWPVRGTERVRDWFSEEHHAQHELRRAGWEVGWVAGQAAERDVPEDCGRGQFLRRRVRQAARLQAVEPADRRKDAVRAVAQLAAGPHRLARAVRAADGVGWMLGPRLVRDEIEPVHGSTPFVHTVPLPAPRSARRARGASGTPQAVVLLYHRVTASGGSPAGLVVSPEHFAEQCAVLRARHRVVGLDERAEGEVVLTFDDGYIDNLRHAAPVLAEHGLPATLYVTTAPPVLWWDVIHRGLAERPLPIVLGDRAWNGHGPEVRRMVATAVQARDPRETAELLAGWDPPGAAGEEDRLMTSDELREAARTFTIGAHTRSHPSLAFVDAVRVEEEVRGCLDDLEALLGARPTSFAYPFGVPGVDVDDAAVEAVRAAGLRTAVVNAPGRPTSATDPLRIPRHFVPDVGGDEFAAWLAGVLRGG